MRHDETFGNRIRELRKKYNLTQLELSGLVGIPKSTLAGYENGLRRPQFEVLERLVETLNTSSDYLIGITDDPTPAKPNKDLIKLLKSEDYHIDGKKLNNDDMEFAIKFLEKMFKKESSNNSEENYITDNFKLNNNTDVPN